jgi:cytochrome c553
MLSAAIYYSSLSPVHIIDDDLPGSSETGDETSNSPDSVDDQFLSIRDSMRKCIKCHGESGNASGSGMPNLTAQDPDYFTTSMLAYVDGSRSHKLMKRLVGKLDEATIRQMGIFYGVQEPQMTETRGDGDARVGRRLAEDCGGCHGDDGNSNKASMPTLAGQDAKYFIKAMKHYKDGTRQHEKMFEAVEALNDQEIMDLASFYANQQPLRRDVRMPLKSTEWISRCERCHGINGNSTDPRFPLLAGQDKAYLQASLKAYANDNRSSKTMHAMADPLSAMDIERISSFFASQQPSAVIYMQIPCQDDQ